MSGRQRSALPLVAAGVGVVAAGAAVGYFYWQSQRLELPELSQPDLNQARHAGVCNISKGTVYWKPAVENEEQQRNVASDAPPKSPARAKEEGWQPMKKGDPVLLGSVFYVGPDAMFRVQTTGEWLVTLDGEGEFIFQDARTNEARDRHTVSWFVKKGTFRAKALAWNPKGEYLIEVSTRRSKVIGNKGPLGMRVNEEGGGQVWLWKGGEATLVKNGNERKELVPMKPDYL